MPSAPQSSSASHVGSMEQVRRPVSSRVSFRHCNSMGNPSISQSESSVHVAMQMEVKPVSKHVLVMPSSQSASPSHSTSNTHVLTGTLSAELLRHTAPGRSKQSASLAQLKMHDEVTPKSKHVLVSPSVQSSSEEHEW